MARINWQDLLTTWRARRRMPWLEALLIGAAMAVPLLVAGHGFAQVQQIDRADRADRADREAWRLERRIGEVEKTQNTFQLDMERRLTKIETLLYSCLAILGVVGSAVAAQVCASVVAWVRRAAPAGKSGSD